MRGWVVGLLVVVLVIVGGAAAIIAALVGTSSSTSIVDLEVGDCFDLPPEEELARFETVDVIDCDEPHGVEVVFVADLNPDGDLPYPPDEELFPLAERRCAVVADSVPLDVFGIVPLAPTEDTWDGADGRLSCLALPLGGGTTTGSIVAAEDG